MPNLRLPLFLITLGFFLLSWFPSLWLAIPATILFVFALIAWIVSLFILRSDPQKRKWVTQVKYTGSGYYKWDWQLSADDYIVSRFKTDRDTYSYSRSGKTETRLGALWEAALKRRETIRDEKRDAKSGKEFAVGGARKNSTDSQRRISNPLSAYFQWVENLLHRDKEKS